MVSSSQWRGIYSSSVETLVLRYCVHIGRSERALVTLFVASSAYQNWRCGMNRKSGYGAQLRANLDPTKGVGRLRQQDGGHGSRNPLRSV
ncbi:hypothetical protein PIB30_107681 [Stylosanthes scabra]|uniref:Uncharacterized protein n=1 Tax=Stylosanthes scabra TaxID=79078 RepID=A0ABU6RZS2_9FABA|nr:hypothetical protein [Stylosanthes scabra]